MKRTDLDNLPTHRGFRLRGTDMTRIETFTDAAFAFAVTLLVVSIDAIPRSYDELVIAMKGVPAFAISFLLMLAFWFAHHVWSRRYGLDDGITVLLSCLLVFLIMVYVYPLKMMASGMVAFFTAMIGAPISGGFTLKGPGDLHGLFIVYSSGFVFMSLTILLLNLHAFRQRDRIGLNELEIYDTRSEINAWLIMIAVGLFSVTLAIVVPATSRLAMWGIPGWAYMLLAFLMPWHGIRSDKIREARFGKFE